jgi:4-alpha-glucanotransferase
VTGTGITDGHHRTDGTWHATSSETDAALRAAMGLAPGEVPSDARPVWFVRCGAADRLLGPCRLVLEDGSDLGVVAALPPDLPAGYHDLLPEDGGPTTRVIASPGRCHLPEDLRGWLWAVQLYAARSRSSWGIGDLGDLASIAGAAARDGAWGVAVSPMHAPLPTSTQEASPYFPSSRRWLNPLLVCIDDVPVAADDAEITALGEQARELLTQRRIDRDAVWRLKRAALERAWQRARPRPDASYSAWRDAQGGALLDYARFCALAEHHACGWLEWPDAFRHPSSAAVARFASDHADLVELHAWIQWLLHVQLGNVRATTVVADLAIGVDPNGADAWLQQDVLALDVHVGAPPDEFATDGQDWGLPPFVPWKLRAAAYEPLVDVLRAAMRTGGLRIDHVMGLFRLFWIPEGVSPDAGAYVRFPGRELLELVCIESTRAGAVVIGEDLGTVEDEVRRELADAAVLSTRIAWFEDAPPETYPRVSFAAITTHDLPTIAGVWSGADAAMLRAMKRERDAEAADGLRDRLVALLGVAQRDLPTDTAEVARRAHERLAAAGSMLVAATLEDFAGVEQRPNLPGTIGERANWSIALPSPVDELLGSPAAQETAQAFRAAGR